MCWASTKWTLLTVGLLGGILAILQVFEMWQLTDLKYSRKYVVNTEVNDVPIILWWTSSFGEDERYRHCGDKQCYFTKKRSSVTNPLLKAILFYGSNLELDDLPIPRKKHVRWALFHEESPRNNPMFIYQSALGLFNYSATFSRYSDVPLTLLSLPGERELITTSYFLPVKEKNLLLVTKKLAPVLYIQSNCDTPNDRDSYIAELMKYIPVDSYGACLNNRRLPESLTVNYLEKLDADEFLTFAGQYKFTLAFENAVCDDYITEKLWRPLIVGSVPIYYGSPSFKDWLPNNTSAIAVEDFESPKDLADFVIKLNNDNENYEKYLVHKMSDNDNRRITNHRVLAALRARSRNSESLFGDTIRNFECHVCEKLHNTKSLSTVTKKQFNCSLPKSVVPLKKNVSNLWTYQFSIDKCSAKLLVQHVSNGTKINIDSFTRKAFEMYENNDCE
ncbi:alpha-(1,3)-fucosyltransferase 10 isoform X2 [Venturia canescens]|uniref:alpha-(1,3)-fucosyltransferase 10 isoform X2 n=1 Tax=Venturia canescens TaxID=32260 RepID=UPI001C9C913C|nr:alpha-(1,3)-fucosyltransferase 10 isoform X2 [Venturia canescens]